MHWTAGFPSGLHSAAAAPPRLITGISDSRCMAADNKLRQRVSFGLGTVCALASIPLILSESRFSGWFVAVSAAWYLVLPWTAFFRPREHWRTGLAWGCLAMAVYSLCWPFWGALMAPEDGSDDWWVFLLLGIVALNIIVPLVRGYAGRKRVA